jgi:hypothetical protein
MTTDFYSILSSVAIAGAAIVGSSAAIIGLVLTRAHFRAGEDRAEKQFRAAEERAKKHEQFRICREIWVELLKQNRLIHEWPLEDAPDYKMLKRYMDLLKNDLDYFVFFVKKGEINAPDILEYYSKRVDDVNETSRGLASMSQVWRNGMKQRGVLDLIREYKELTKNRIK